MKKEIETIARERMGIESLEERGMDDLDFHTLGVLTLKAALELAYRAGRRSAQIGRDE